jgi:ketosteroid isomerase-like protein
MIAQSKGWYRSVLTAAAVTAAAVQTARPVAAWGTSPLRARNVVVPSFAARSPSQLVLSESTADGNHYPQQQPSSSPDCSPKMGEEERNDATVIYQLEESSDTVAKQSNSSSSDGSISKVLEKKIRVAKAQAEIDRILSQPEDAPFDVETEMKKVLSIAPLPSMITPSESSDVTRLEQDMLVRHEEAASHDIERELYEAVRKQDYATAAKKRALLDQMHMDDALAALQCNAAFYKAFSKKDYPVMELLWLQEDSVVCIHPSHAPIVSAKNINAAWQQMFASPSGNFQRMWIEPRNIRVSVQGGGHGAVVTCDEHVWVRRFVRGQKRQTECINRLTATNIFRKVASRWYMVHHHASWHAESDAARQALARGGASAASYLQSLQRRQDATEGKRSGGLEGILGMKDFGPLLGSSSKKLQSAESVPVAPRRIVMGTGSLSDILNGNLEDLLRGAGKSDTSSKDGNDESGGSIIQFHRIQSSGDAADDDDDDNELADEDDDEEVEEVEIELTNRDHGSKEAFSIIKEWTETRGKPTPNKSSPLSTDVAKKSPKSVKEDDQRSKCLSMIRHLCQQGLISSKQKRVLLSDMIVSAAQKESSMIQVAYEFLFASDADTDMAEEEFADQCRRIAESLPDL